MNKPPHTFRVHADVIFDVGNRLPSAVKKGQEQTATRRNKKCSFVAVPKQEREKEQSSSLINLDNNNDNNDNKMQN
jgi:hypothetical protein